MAMCLCATTANNSGPGSRGFRIAQAVGTPRTETDNPNHKQKGEDHGEGYENAKKDPFCWMHVVERVRKRCVRT